MVTAAVWGMCPGMGSSWTWWVMCWQWHLPWTDHSRCPPPGTAQWSSGARAWWGRAPRWVRFTMCSPDHVLFRPMMWGQCVSGGGAGGGGAPQGWWGYMRTWTETEEEEKLHHISLLWTNTKQQEGYNHKLDLAFNNVKRQAQRLVFGCQDAAKQVLMSFCPCVCVWPMLKFYLLTAFIHVSRVHKRVLKLVNFFVQNFQKPYMFDLVTHSPSICDALWSISHIGGLWAPLKNCFVVLHPCVLWF